MTKKIKCVADLPGVGEKTADKLKESGFVDMMAIAAAGINELSKAATLGEATAQKIIEAAQEACNIDFEPATKVYEKRLAIGKITTGSKVFDELLGGGIETNSITEVFGAFGSSKTQIAHQLCISVQLPLEQGGLNGNALYIDSEASFRPERIKQMAESLELDSEKVLENTFTARAYSSDHQIALILRAGDLIKAKNIKLVIVDSITGLFRSDYTGRGELANRQQKLSKHLRQLQRLSEVHNVAIFVTNQVMTNPGLLFGDPTKAIGGHVLHHATKTRIYLRKSREGKRICRLVDSPHLPDGECIILITENGVEDLKEKKKKS